MKFVYLFCVAWALAPLVHAQCSEEYHIHEIFAEPGGVKSYTQFGERTLKASKVNINDCPDFSGQPTGTQDGTTTIISYTAPLRTATSGTGKCRVNNSTGENHWYTFSGLKVEANGWKFQPQEIELSNVDIEPAPAGGGSGNQETLRKASIVFGYNGNSLVWPQYTIPGGSLLRTQEFWIKGQQMGYLGFPSTDQFPYGVMWGQLSPQVVPNYLADCTTDQTQCRAIASFNEPVDGLYVLFAGENKSATVNEAMMNVGPIKSSCGCRCETSPINANRVVTRPSGIAGECTKSMSQSGHLYCTNLGTKWCERGTKDTYVSSGPALAGSGNYPCTIVNKAYAIQQISPFSPTP